jgi:hypothetical protein
MRATIQFTVAAENDLNELLVGRRAGHDVPWRGRSPNLRLTNGATGVVWRQGPRRGDPVQPLVLVSREEEHRRLCGRFAQLRSDLSPLTAWCHLLTPERFEVLDDLSRDADLGGYEAAWTGLIVAEALLLAERSVSKLRIAACLATQSFAVARALALWGNRISIADVLKRFDSGQRLFRGGETSGIRLRTLLQPIWDVLVGVAAAELVPGNSELSPIIESLRKLNDARLAGDDNAARWFSQPLNHTTPEAAVLAGLSSLSPEQRLQEFDRLVARLNDKQIIADPRRRLVLTLLAGFLATVAAGGLPSLALAEANARQWPEITAWAYVTGGIGERVVWTSSFDGLGRLVARELMRPLRLDEPPMCDAALDEAQVIVDPALKDPLVNLKLKQARIVSLALLPGVNISIPIGEPLSPVERASDISSEATTEMSARAREKSYPGQDPLAVLADAIWPYLETRLDKRTATRARSKTSGLADGSRRRGRLKVSQAGLPLKEPDK